MSDPDKINGINRNRGISATYSHDYQGVLTGEYEDDRAEKPWQRVPSTILILLLGVYLLLAFLTQVVEDDMPAVVHEADLKTDNSDKFSEEVAWRYLDRILGKEPRVSGTKYHLTQTADLKAMLDDLAAQATQVVKTDWQIASGDYLHVSKTSFVNMYQNASNVVALLEGESGFHPNGTLGSSVLVNCHYDSVPFALGASDNAVFCAIMAEVLTKLSRSQKKLKRNILFLFNGAEENGLQASHAFLQHPWAKGASVVINLDAAGMNGKPMIFQVTDPRVLNAYYRSVSLPNAQGIAEFLFSSGIIPSDTDFRIWRDFGNITGVDIAFVKWASVYHTRNDKPELVQDGVLQAGGDTLLELLTHTADADELDQPIEPTTAVYYDYLNVFLVKYSFTASYIIDVAIALLGLASVAYYLWLVGARWSTVQNLLFTALGRLASVVVGVMVVAIFTLLMVATTVQMRYLTNPWLVVPLYWVPYIVAAVGTAQAYDAWTLKRNGLNRSLRCLQAMAATRLLMSLILLCLVCVPSLVTLRYLFSAPLFIMSIASVISITIVKYVTLRGWQHLLLEVSLSLPSVMFMFSLALRVNAQMLPIMGRSGGDTPDSTVAILNMGLAMIVCCTISGIELLFSRKFLWQVLSLVGAICVVLMFIPFSPYDEEGISLQRHYWLHSEIVRHDINKNVISRTSGVLVSKLDPYTTTHVGPALNRAGLHVVTRADLRDDCQTHVYCGVPLFRTGFSSFLNNAMFMYTGPPAPFSPPPDVTVRARDCAGDECRYRFDFTGAHHNFITLWPRDNITVSSWSFSSSPRVSFEQLNRPVYVIYHSAATYNEQAIQFTVDVTFKVPPSQQTQPIVDLSLHSHKIHHPEDFTPEYNAILSAMPPYFNVATFLSFRNDYIF